jgi:hypothetical protein
MLKLEDYIAARPYKPPIFVLYYVQEYVVWEVEGKLQVLQREPDEELRTVILAEGFKRELLVWP